MHEAYTAMVRDLYALQTTTFSCRGQADGVRVYVPRGIKQGVPVPPFLFNLELDPLLDRLKSSAVGITNGE